jgi:hypothetical protein
LPRCEILLARRVHMIVNPGLPAARNETARAYELGLEGRDP